MSRFFNDGYKAIRLHLADFSNNTSVPQGQRFTFTFVCLEREIIHVGSTIAPANISGLFHALRKTKKAVKKTPKAFRNVDKYSRLRFFIKADPDGYIKAKIEKAYQPWG